MPNNRRHSDGFSVAASPTLQSRACCGRWTNGKKAIMKSAVSIMLLAIFLAWPLCKLSLADETSGIVGKWAAVARTKGGLGARYYFQENGVVLSSFGALVDFDYQIEDKVIKMSLKGEKEQVDSTPFEIVEDKLILNPADPDKRQEMTRSAVTTANAHTIVGIWSYKHYTGGMATMQYTTKGLAQLSVPFDALSGAYKVQGQDLQINFNGKPSLRRKIHLEGNRLIFLPDGQKKQEEYLRVEP
jgi:hypothetical protein